MAPVLDLVLAQAQALVPVQDSVQVPAPVRVLEQAAPDLAFPVRSPAYMH